MASPSKKMYQPRKDGQADLRIWHRKEQKKGKGMVMPRYLIKCGCCDSEVKIFYGEGLLEINGVNGSIENWREILLPLLEQK